MWSIRYSCRSLMKLEFFQQFFEKSSNVRFRQNPPSGSRGVPCGRTDGRTWNFSDFCECGENARQNVVFWMFNLAIHEVTAGPQKTGCWTQSVLSSNRCQKYCARSSVQPTDTDRMSDVPLLRLQVYAERTLSNLEVLIPCLLFKYWLINNQTTEHMAYWMQ